MRSRTLCVIGLLVGAVLARAQTSIGFTMPVAPADQVLQRLGRQIGIPLRAQGTIEKEFLLVDVAGVTPEDLLARIATTLEAEWRTSDGTRYLVRTGAVEARIQKREVALRTQRLRNALLELENLGPWNQDSVAKMATESVEMARSQLSGGRLRWESVESGRRQTPLVRLLTRLTLDNAEAIAAQPPWLRTVYSDKATKMQARLSATSADRLATFLKEQTLWSDAVAAARKPDERLQDWGALEGSAKLKGLPVRILLMALRSPFSGSVDLTVKLIDDKGRVVGESRLPIGDFLQRMTREEMGATVPDDDPAIAFSEETRAVQQQLASLRVESRTAPQLPQSFLEKALDPAKHEPLAGYASELLRGIARAGDANLVARPSDMLSLLAFAPTPKMTVSVARRWVSNLADMEILEDGGWLCIRPRMPLTTRLLQVDRGALGAYLRAARSKDYLTIDELITFAKSSDANMDELPLVFWSVLLAPAASPDERRNWDALRLLGSMDPAQRGAFGGDIAIPLGNLNPSQVVLANRIVYGGPPGLQFAGQRTPEEASMPPGQSLRYEPTESLPTGLPRTGTLTIGQSEDDVVLGMREGGDFTMGRPRAMTSEAVAQERYYADNPDKFPWFSQNPRVTRFLEGRRTEASLRFAFGTELTQTIAIRVHAYDATSKAKAFEELSGDFRLRVEAEYKRLTDVYREFLPGGIGPPPP